MQWEQQRQQTETAIQRTDCFLQYIRFVAVFLSWLCTIYVYADDILAISYIFFCDVSVCPFAFIIK